MCCFRRCYAEEVLASAETERKRRSAQVSRQLRLLRGHGLLKKVPKTHRYLVTAAGRTTVTALLAARDVNADTLTKNVA